MKITTKAAGALILGLIAVIGCSREENIPLETGETPSITEIYSRNKWNNRADAIYQVEAHVKDPQGPHNLSSVSLEILEDPSGVLLLSDSLLDDGGYANSGSGDVLAGDGVFSNRFKAADINPTLLEETFTLRVTAMDKDNHVSPSVDLPLVVGANHRPSVLNIGVPDSLSVDVPDIVFTVTVSDSDGINDVVEAYFESDNLSKGYTKFEQYLYDDGDQNSHGDETAGDGIFSTKITPEFSGGKKGDYALNFYAVDSYGESNLDPAVRQIYIGNLPPDFINISMPDTMHIPESETAYNYQPITVQVADPEGLTTIDSVYFYSLKPDLTYANDGKPLLLVDNGYAFNENAWWIEAGDVKAGDGIYTYALVVLSDFSPGNYKFSFYIRDKAGNLTGPEIRTIGLIGKTQQ